MFERMIGMTEELEDIAGPLEGLGFLCSSRPCHWSEGHHNNVYQYEHGYIEPRREKTFYDYEW